MSFDFLNLANHEGPLFSAKYALGPILESEKMGTVLDGTWRGTSYFTIL